jgi:hypothetical protein
MTKKNKEIEIERVWAMPNKWTFTIKPIKELLNQEVGNGFLVNGIWCDPFAGMNSPAKVTNDLNPKAKSDYHLDALEFLKTQKSGEFDGVLYDPPYSISQASECYDNFGKDKLKVSVANMNYWKQCKNEVGRITKSNGKVICFGWNSMGLGKNRGFKMNRILLVAHGGSKNDTIVTVETKL